MTAPDRLRALLANEPGLVTMPAVWDGLTAKMTAAAGFKTAAAKFSADAKAAGAAKDAAGFADAFKTVQADCGGCHKTYRVTAH